MQDPVTRDFIIAPADEADCDWCLERHATVYSEEFGLDARFGERVARTMAELRARETGFVDMRVVTVAGARAGFICVSDLPEGGSFLNFVWVEQDFRRRGIAEALMREALDRARAEGCRFVRLKTFSILEGARRLYARFGFVIDEVQKDFSDFGPVFDVEFWRLEI